MTRKHTTKWWFLKTDRHDHWLRVEQEPIGISEVSPCRWMSLLQWWLSQRWFSILNCVLSFVERNPRFSTIIAYQSTMDIHYSSWTDPSWRDNGSTTVNRNFRVHSRRLLFCFTRGTIKYACGSDTSAVHENLRVCHSGESSATMRISKAIIVYLRDR